MTRLTSSRYGFPTRSDPSGFGRKIDRNNDYSGLLQIIRLRTSFPKQRNTCSERDDTPRAWQSCHTASWRHRSVKFLQYMYISFSFTAFCHNRSCPDSGIESLMLANLKLFLEILLLVKVITNVNGCVPISSHSRNVIKWLDTRGRHTSHFNCDYNQCIVIFCHS